MSSPTTAFPDKIVNTFDLFSYYLEIKFVMEFWSMRFSFPWKTHIYDKHLGTHFVLTGFDIKFEPKVWPVHGLLNKKYIFSFKAMVNILDMGWIHIKNSMKLYKTPIWYSWEKINLMILKVCNLFWNCFPNKDKKE